MNSKLSKLVSIVLVVLLIFSAGGCTNTKKGSDADNTNTATTETNDEKVITIDWNGLQYGSVKDDAPIKKIMEEKFNVKFNMIYVDTSKYEELMNLRFANNEIPDVFTAKNINMLTNWANQDLLAEIPEATIKKYAPNIGKEIDSYKAIDANVWKIGQVSGKSYGILAHNADFVYPSPVIWRNDWLANLEIKKLPETLEEFETALYKIAKEDPDKNEKNDTYGLSANGFFAIYGTSGYWPTFWNKVGTEVVWGGIQPEIKEVLKLFNKWYKDGVIDPEFVTGENQGGYWAISHGFVNGRLGMTTRGSYYHWNYPYYEGDLGGDNYQDFTNIQPKTASYDFGRPAISSNGKTGMGIGGVLAYFTVFGEQLNEDNEKLARILKILDTLASDYDLYLTAKYGVEGKHWEYTKENEPMAKEDVVDALGGQDAIGAGNAFLPWQSMDLYRKTRPFHFTFADKVVSYEKYGNAIPVGLPSTSKYQTDLDKLQDQTFMKIITGDQSIDTFDTFVEQWKKLGGDQLTKEANEWYKSVSGN